MINTESLINRIDTYIDIYTSADIFDRGEKLFLNGAIKSDDIDLKKGTASFTVQGTALYDITINGLNTSINSHCNCPYSWGPVCKHQVACLLYIASKFDKTRIVQPEDEKPESIEIPKKDKLRHSTTPYEIKNYEKITLYHFNDSLDNSKFSYYDLDEEDISFNKDIFLVKVLELERSYGRPKKYSVRFWFKNKKLYTKCTCKRRVDKLCPHQAYALEKLYFEQEDFFSQMVPENLKKIKKTIAEDFGLSEKTVEKHGFFHVLDYEIFWNFEEPYNKLFPVSGSFGREFYQNINENIQEFDSVEARIGIAEDMLVESKQKKMLGFIIEPMNKYMKTEKDLLNFTLFTGTLNKTEKSFRSTGLRFTETHSAEDIVVLNSTQKKLMGQIAALQQLSTFYKSKEFRTEGKSIKREKFHSIQTKFYLLINDIFSLLSQEPFVFFNTSPYTRNSQLHANQYLKKQYFIPVTIAQERVKPEFELKEEEEFLYLELYLSTGEDRFLYKNRNKEFSQLHYSVFENRLYMHHSAIDSFFMLDFFDWPKRVSKAGADSFIKNLIIPLAKQYKVTFDTDLYSIQQKELKSPQKQVYLSEIGPYIALKPVIAYENNVKVNPLVKGGDMELKGDKLVEYIRNDDFEQEFISLLKNLHPDFETQQHTGIFYLASDFILDDFWFFDAYETLEKEGVEIFGVKELKSFSYSPYRAKINTGIKSGQDWFEVNVEVAFGDNLVKLSELKKSLVNDSKYIKLKDGSVGMLPEEWVNKLRKYFRAGEIEKDKVKISKLKFSLIDELFDKIDDFEIKKELAEKKKRLQSVSNIKNVRKPREITATLRDYQKEGLNWLHFLHEMRWGGILADDMGLGKTLQVLTFLQKIIKTSKKPNLIVVPTTLLFNWELEIQKFAPKMKYHIYHGINRDKEIAYFKEYHLIFTTYGVIGRDIDFLRTFSFNYIILDESQAIKNPASMRYKAAALLKAKNRLALTGTPIENSTFDLYAQMNFVNPGFLGTVNSFKKNYSKAIDKEGNPVIAKELNKIVNPFILRRTKEQVAADLPEKTENILFCEMPAEQRAVYDAFRNKYRDSLLQRIEKEGIQKSKIYILEGLTKLRQICDSPALLNEKEKYDNTSVKIEELVRHINEKTANHKILIFSQFVKMLHLIQKELDGLRIEYEYFDGKSTAKRRKESVQNFQENDGCRVFLISIKAGGTGLNLTAADYVYIVDPWWNPAVENQAIDRTHRIGQGKKVFAYRLICKNSVEEKILNLQSKKKKIASDIITTDEGLMQKLTQEDISQLFG